MKDQDLGKLIARVKDGALSRRSFIKKAAAVGLAAPFANQLLAFNGVAMADSTLPYKPTKAGGGGPLKMLLWQAPTLLNPHFASGTKTRSPRASSTSRSPAGTRRAISSRSSRPKSRARPMAASRPTARK
jgi:hypothetical protein